jgi:hypothetical protein
MGGSTVGRHSTIVAVIVGAIIGLCSVTQVFADPWPINPNYATPPPPPQPWVYPNGVNLWCPRVFNGSYSTVFFSQAQAWVNYGGTCNAQWGQNAGWMIARAKRYNGVTLTAQSNVSNAFAATYVQAQVARDTAATTYTAQGDFYDGQKWRSIAACYGSGCN